MNEEDRRPQMDVHQEATHRAEIRSVMSCVGFRGRYRIEAEAYLIAAKKVISEPDSIKFFDNFERKSK